MTVTPATTGTRPEQRLFEFDNTYAERLAGFGAPWEPSDVPIPTLVTLNSDLATSLGLDPEALAADDAVALFAGAASPEDASPIAQVYAGHQFGNFSPQLGDGRAVLLGEIVDPAGRRFDIALKGSGRTPFSRGGDGKASLGPVLREYLMGEAMHALGVPTTRALAVATTGEMVRREGLL
ncbi:MAG: protein adenylyltransferase SelO family protein, partial [Ilumatobacter sp.]